MLQRYAKLNCDYGKKLNITGCLKKLVIYLYQHSDTEKKNHTEQGATTYSKLCTEILEIIQNHQITFKSLIIHL